MHVRADNFKASEQMCLVEAECDGNVRENIKRQEKASWTQEGRKGWMC